MEQQEQKAPEGGDSASQENQQLVKNAFKNASFLMILQIFAKITTMSLNFLVARFVQKDIYGYANKPQFNLSHHILSHLCFIQLQLFYSMILFFSKESLRRACQREVQMTQYSKPIIHQSAQNMIILCFPIQLIAAVIIFGIVQAFYFQPQLQYFTLTIFIICISALIENLCEPFYVNQLLRLDLTYRIKSEFEVKEKVTEIYVLPEHKKDLMEFSKVSVVKFILTEGEKFIIFAFNEFSLDVQAEFGLVSNLISIICRFVFQPIEEMAFNLFSKFKKQSADSSQPQDAAQDGVEGRQKSRLEDPLYVLAKITQFLSLIGISMVLFGVFFSRKFIKLVYTEMQNGQQKYDFVYVKHICRALNRLWWPTVSTPYSWRLMESLKPKLLIRNTNFKDIRTYLYLCESISSNFKEASKGSGCDLGVSISLSSVTNLKSWFRVYIIASLGLSRVLGIQGLIYGNCVNMSMRILMSMYYSLNQEAIDRNLQLRMSIQKKQNFLYLLLANDSKQPKVTTGSLIKQFIKDACYLELKIIAQMLKNRRK